jgi:hypothetical protein
MENLSLHRDGIFGIFGTRLESMAPCYSQSFYWRIFKKTMLYFVFKKAYKKSAKQENSSLFVMAFCGKEK